MSQSYPKWPNHTSTSQTHHAPTFLIKFTLIYKLNSQDTPERDDFGIEMKAKNIKRQQLVTHALYGIKHSSDTDRLFVALFVFFLFSFFCHLTTSTTQYSVPAIERKFLHKKNWKKNDQLDHKESIGVEFLLRRAETMEILFLTIGISQSSRFFVDKKS